MDKDGLISCFVTKEFKQQKNQLGLTWTNLIGLGFKYKEMQDENKYLWGKIDELNNLLKKNNI